MELTLSDFTLYIVVGSFLLVPIFSLVSRTLYARTEKRALANLVICRLCLHAFEDTTHAPLVPCPLCGAANEKSHRHPLG